MTQSLWFKRVFVEDILNGAKCETIRSGVVAYEPGTILGASVGPRRPFAYLEIVRCETMTPEDLFPDAREKIRAIYPDATTFTRIHFRLFEKSLRNPS